MYILYIYIHLVPIVDEFDVTQVILRPVLLQRYVDALEGEHALVELAQAGGRERLVPKRGSVAPSHPARVYHIYVYRYRYR